MHEQYDLVSNLVEEIEVGALGGVNLGFAEVNEDASQGLADAFYSAPTTLEGNQLRNPIKDSLIDLTKAAASKSDYPTFLSVSHNLNHQMAGLLRRRPDSDVTYRLVEKLLQKRNE